LAIIDTAPTADNAALEATKAADLVLVPCQPSDFDLGAVGATVRLASQIAGKPSWVVMNAVPPGLSHLEFSGPQTRSEARF